MLCPRHVRAITIAYLAFQHSTVKLHRVLPFPVRLCHYPVSAPTLFAALLMLPTRPLWHHPVLLTAIPMLSASKPGSSFILLLLLLYLFVLLLFRMPPRLYPIHVSYPLQFALHYCDPPQSIIVYKYAVRRLSSSSDNQLRIESLCKSHSP